MNIGEYTVTAQLTKDPAYQWVEAVDKNQENPVILQLVQPGIPEKAIADTIAYFDKLQLIRRKGIWRPEQMFSDDAYPLVIVYPYWKTRPLKEILKPNSLDEEALEWWHQASETLHALHNKDLVHGYININQFAIADQLLYLTGFGYAPLLKLGYTKFLPSESDALAPEVLDKKQVTKAADIYAFAKTIASFYPQLIETSWYSKATDPKLDKRFKRMRNLFDGLQEIFHKLFVSPSEEQSSSDISEVIPETKPKTPESNIVPKYTLSARVEPPEAGKVMGGGNYAVDKNVKITASKAAGWNFAYWTGDVSGVDSQVTVKMDGDKNVVAHFTAEVKEVKTEFIPESKPKPEPKPERRTKSTTPVLLNLWVSAEPAEAGTVDGGGEYETGTSVTVRAWAATQLWRFDHWSGDLKGSENPAQLLMDANKKIQAHFTKVSLKSNKLFPRQTPFSQSEPETQPSTNEESQEPIDTPPKKRSPGIPKWAQPGE